MNKTRPKQLSFRVNEEEYQQLQEKVFQSGKNQQEYILSCVLEPHHQLRTVVHSHLLRVRSRFHMPDVPSAT